MRETCFIGTPIRVGASNAPMMANMPNCKSCNSGPTRGVFFDNKARREQKGGRARSLGTRRYAVDADSEAQEKDKEAKVRKKKGMDNCGQCCM
jgi:hypothetical protein